MTELAWLAEGDVLSVGVHHACIKQHTCRVAVDGQDRPAGFLNAEVCRRDLHILAMSVALPVPGRDWGSGCLPMALRMHAGAACQA
ncbi:hypothetical protein [Komagataeibacter sp. FNDCF1]|uniref:hypothetical protein n=1 Tax=Komagataeibacter sp. FNDCF1 TaxID=2878681 RepID=UPI001E32FCA0|nr:hypothetical protein [Komagataeibacter sp. FNDCF1]MCE2565032.1 hypothetical protein [Komagataeibacter sp. FNDCF1]